MISLKITRVIQAIVSFITIVLIVGCCDDKKPIDPRISANLDNFINILTDPKQNVHAVVLASPGKDGNLVVLNNFLSPVKPCFTSSKPNDKLQSTDITENSINVRKELIQVEPQCIEDKIQSTKGKILPLEDESKIIVLTPGITIDNYKNSQRTPLNAKSHTDNSTFLFITDTDKKQHQTCHNPDNSPCPPRY